MRPGVASNGIRPRTDYKSVSLRLPPPVKNKIGEKERTRTRIALFGSIRKELSMIACW
jgi:hypothetical protein